MRLEGRHYDSDLSDLGPLRDDEIPLAESALRVAAAEYPALDAARWLGELDRLARRAGELSGPGGDAGLLEGINRALYEEAGFHGNSSDYYDPRNSFLNDVIERRTGIPISLAVIYIEVAHRLGVLLHGIGFPGHFLVGRPAPEGLEIIDAFNQGVRLAREQCVELVVSAGSSPEAFEERYLAPVTNRQILVRMLTNLKLIYLRRQDFTRAVGAMDRILQVSPGSVQELRDRGLVHLQSGSPNRALRDLHAYVDAAPPDADLDPVRAAINAARRSLASLN